MAGIFDGLEKLINEHGSANILRERLALVKEQYDVVERKLSECQQENTSLHQRLKQLERENEKLKQTVGKNSTQFADFNETTHRILRVFFDQPDDISAEQVADRLGIDRSFVNYHFDLLREAKFISQTRSITASSPAMYSITSSGRKYVVKHSI